MDGGAEAPLAPALRALAGAGMRLAVGDHAGLAHALPLAWGIKAISAVDRGASEVAPDLLSPLLPGVEPLRPQDQGRRRPGRAWQGSHHRALGGAQGADCLALVGFGSRIPQPLPPCFSAVGFLRVVMMPIFLPSCMSLSLLPPEASSGLGQRQLRQGWGCLLWHWDRRPWFGDEAAQGQRCLVEQGHQDQVPTPTKDTDQSQAGGTPRPRLPGTRAVTSGTVLTGIVSSASPPTLRSHRVATATASHRRAARSGLVMWVRCHGQPARLVILKPCSIHARNPYQQAVLASGGRSVRITHGSLSPASQQASRVQCSWR